MLSELFGAESKGQVYTCIPTYLTISVQLQLLVSWEVCVVTRCCMQCSNHMLQHKSEQHLAAGSREERTVRLDNLHQNRIAVQHSASQEPLLEQKCVKYKMAKFHKDIAALSSPTCITCMELFPGLKVNSRSECARCGRDKHTSKLYSMANTHLFTSL